MDRVCRAFLEEHSGSRDESPSSNLGHVKQWESIRVDDMGPQSQGEEAGRVQPGQSLQL